MSFTSSPDNDRVRRELAATMAPAAANFLDSLDAKQRGLVAWPFPSNEERERWFYTPTDHGGLALSSMSSAQQRLLFRLLAAGLSRAGYVTVSIIIGLDNVLDEVENFVMSWGRGRGRDPGLYYVRIFGDPAANRDWSWRFGGHHVSLSHTVVQGSVASVTPCFFGADPASSPLLGPHPLRPLAGAEDYARELVQSLTDEQRKRALVSEVAPVDLVGANRSHLVDGNMPLPLSDIWRNPFIDDENAERVRAIQAMMEKSVGLLPHHIEAVKYTTISKGINAALLSTSQKAQLRLVLDAYLRRMPDALAEFEAAKYDGDRIQQLSFLWAGGVEAGQGHYYRVQGPRIVVEYDNVARNANHVHAVWRDPAGDFATDVLAAHLDDDHREGD